MAYLIGTAICVERSCGKPATQVLNGSRNEEIGRFCDRHAKGALATRQRQEDDWYAAEQSERQKQFQGRTP